MANQYSFDIGFDCNATPDENGNLPLNIGLVNVTSGTPQPNNSGDSTYNLQVGDSFFLNCFDITAASYPSLAGNLAFPDGSPSDTSSVALTQTTVSAGSSSIFTTSSPLLMWPVCEPQEISSAGSFPFNVTLTVQGPEGTQTFVTGSGLTIQATSTDT